MKLHSLFPQLHMKEQFAPYFGKLHPGIKKDGSRRLICHSISFTSGWPSSNRCHHCATDAIVSKKDLKSMCSTTTNESNSWRKGLNRSKEATYAGNNWLLGSHHRTGGNCKHPSSCHTQCSWRSGSPFHSWCQTFCGRTLKRTIFQSAFLFGCLKTITIKQKKLLVLYIS